MNIQDYKDKFIYGEFVEENRLNLHVFKDDDPIKCIIGSHVNEDNEFHLIYKLTKKASDKFILGAFTKNDRIKGKINISKLTDGLYNTCIIAQLSRYPEIFFLIPISGKAKFIPKQQEFARKINGNST